jgi:hypothetical protein
MNRRMLMLLAVLGALLALNLLDDTQAGGVIDVVAPVVRQAAGDARMTPPASSSAGTTSAAPGLVALAPASAGLPAAIDADPFAMPTPTPTPTPRPVAAPVKAASAPPPPPPPAPPPPPEPAPPLQVIGFWQQEGQGYVLIAGPGGVARARPGDVVFAEFVVEQLQSGRVALRRQRDQRRFELAAPALPPGMAVAAHTPPQKAPATAQVSQGEKD